MWPFLMHAEIRIVLTAALSDYCYDMRKEQYIKSFNALYRYGYKDFYIVEALKKEGHTFLDDYCDNVFYSQANLADKPVGYNEAATLLDALYYFDFAPDDIIVKLTGRHSFATNALIKRAETMTSDALFKQCNKKELTWYTVAFAMRCDELIKMLEWITHNFLNPMNLEHHVGLYFGYTKELCVESIKRLFVHCHSSGSLSWQKSSTKIYLL